MTFSVQTGDNLFKIVRKIQFLENVSMFAFICLKSTINLILADSTLPNFFLFQ